MFDFHYVKTQQILELLNHFIYFSNIFNHTKLLFKQLKFNNMFTYIYYQLKKKVTS